MPKPISADSVGIITPQTVQFDTQLQLESGKKLDRYQIIYETYGTLNAQKSNAILICHALSGDHHAAGYHNEADEKPGWWDNMIGFGKPFDTNKFFIVSLNNLGGCKGSTGPTTINPATAKPYGPDFPIVTVKDWVQSQYQLMLKLDIPSWAAVIGGSLGGMQALQWSIDFPDKVKHAIIIAASPRLSAQNIAFNEVAREAIISDPEFHGGHYYEHHVLPRRGVMLARMLGHITYLSNEAMHDKFGRELREGKINYDYQKDFQVESYLHHQGKSFVERFDANSYLLMTKALDYFDPAKDYDNSLSKALAHTRCDFLIVSFTSDWRFSPSHSREIVRALLDVDKAVSYVEIVAAQGHDSFLLPDPQYMKILTSYLNNVADKCTHCHE